MVDVLETDADELDDRDDQSTKRHRTGVVPTKDDDFDINNIVEATMKQCN